ncbi:MAG: DUF885 domain-containing protein [Candidatus Kapaibacterium sp.]|nr:DUF885 domain-containing protein [Bacteroidota bacterium]
MKYIIICLLFSLVSININLLAQQQDYNKVLDQIFSEYKDFCMSNYPEWATYEGDHNFDDAVTDNSEDGRQKRRDAMRVLYNRAKEIDENKLRPEYKVHRSLFLFMLEQSEEGEKFNGWMMPLNQQGGLHIDFPLLPEAQKLETPDDLQRYLTRLKQFPRLVENIIKDMQKGMEKGITPPRVLMEKVIPQLDAIINTPTEETPFVKSVLIKLQQIASQKKANEHQTPQLIGTPEGTTISSTAVAGAAAGTYESTSPVVNVVAEYIQPSYVKLRDFIQSEYLPKCREDVGEWSLPNGLERYRYAVRSHTSVNITPDAVFEVGMKEVERIAKQMELLKNKMGFDGTSLQDFNNNLRTNSDNFFTDKSELVKGFDTILTKAYSKLPLLFRKLPNVRCVTKELEEYRSAAAPQAYYYSAPADRSRPGYFYVNTFNLPARPKYTMTALTLHEAVPGHHLQIALAQEQAALPWFRQQMSVTGFVEGWALYAERLGFEMDMYTDPMQHYGALGFEMWRACRLVVDAGIHAKKWSREKAIEYMLNYTVNSKDDIVSEVERYIANPGQATAYKIGQLKILELRARAERELGGQFDIKQFHEVLLQNGAIPLPLLETTINTWIASVKKKK